MKKRTLSLILVLIVILTAYSPSVFATESKTYEVDVSELKRTEWLEYLAVNGIRPDELETPYTANYIDSLVESPISEVASPAALSIEFQEVPLARVMYDVSASDMKRYTVLVLDRSESMYSDSHVGVQKKNNVNVIIPFSVPGSMTMLISEPGTYGVINNKKDFTDISGNWAANTIDFITAREICIGVGENRFDPNGGMTRAMFAQVLANIEGADLTAYKTSRFADVEDGVWFAAALEWAANNSIVGGYGNNLFGPDDLITREQMAIMLNNYIRYKDIELKKDDDYTPFADDSNVSSWAKDAVVDMKRYGLISGVGDNRYAPLDTADRASVAQIFKNFIEAYINII